MNSLSKFQKFEAVVINRDQIKNAKYNPRKISDEARKKLKKKIKDSGIVMALVWNKRTGNLVGGHQRISILDELEKNQNYSLTVSAVDIGDKEEKEMNVFLNNTSAMGEWDRDALEALVKDLDCDISGLGFEPMDIKVLCDSIQLEEKDAANTTIDELNAIKERRKNEKDKNKTKDDADFYVVLVFKDWATVDKFLIGLKLPTNQKYVDGKIVAEKLGIELNGGVDPNDTPERLAKC